MAEFLEFCKDTRGIAVPECPDCIVAYVKLAEKYMAEVAKLRAEVELLKAEGEKLIESQRLRAECAEAEMERLELQVRRLANMLNTSVPHRADHDDPCPADCQRCALEREFPRVTEKQVDEPAERCTCTPGGGALCGYCIRQELNRG